jgi:hypothetical protein
MIADKNTCAGGWWTGSQAKPLPHGGPGEGEGGIGRGTLSHAWKAWVRIRNNRSAPIESVAMSKQRLPMMISKFPAT